MKGRSQRGQGLGRGGQRQNEKKARVNNDERPNEKKARQRRRLARAKVATGKGNGASRGGAGGKRGAEEGMKKVLVCIIYIIVF